MAQEEIYQHENNKEWREKKQRKANYHKPFPQSIWIGDKISSNTEVSAENKADVKGAHRNRTRAKVHRSKSHSLKEVIDRQVFFNLSRIRKKKKRGFHIQKFMLREDIK